MFTYIRSAFASRFDHPLLMGLYVFGLLSLLLGLVFQFVTIPLWGLPHPMVPAFCGVYAVFWAAVASAGYSVVFTVRAVSEARDRMGPAAG